jgi:hypothetical protein
MKRVIALIAAVGMMLVAVPLSAQTPTAPRNYVYMGQDDLDLALTLLERPDVEGVQIMYVWRNLEPRKGEYDFSMIEHDLALAQARGKGMFVEVLDRFFQPASRYLPQYMLDDPEYGGGLARQFDDHVRGQPPVAAGWVARQWDPEVRARFQALLGALAAQFDGRIEGLILTETAANVDRDNAPEGYSCSTYFDAEVENAIFARRAFRRSAVVQYANFWPCGWADANGYMSRFFQVAVANGIGVGGPDIVPNRPGQMRNSYPFIRRYGDQVPLVAMAIQEPTLEYIDPETGAPFTREAFTSFATDYLGVDVIFWARNAPWLSELPRPVP